MSQSLVLLLLVFTSLYLIKPFRKKNNQSQEPSTREHFYSSVNIAKSILRPKDEISFFNKIGALKGFRRKDEYIRKRPYCMGLNSISMLTALDMVHSVGIVMQHNISLGGSGI